MRFMNSICRYDQDDVIRRIFAIIGLPPPPPGRARPCAEGILKAYDFIEKLAGPSPNADLRAQCLRIAEVLEMLDAPRISPTIDQVRDDKQAERSICVVSIHQRSSVEIHAGIGALFYCAEEDTLISQAAPFTGTGMDMRRDYLMSVIEAARDTLEQTFS